MIFPGGTVMTTLAGFGLGLILGMLIGGFIVNLYVQSLLDRAGVELGSAIPRFWGPGGTWDRCSIYAPWGAEPDPAAWSACMIAG
jgi:hypothetical protein